MKERWIICLGAGESQVSLIRNAQFIGYHVLAIDRNPKAPGFEYANEIMLESTYHTEKIIEKLEKREWFGLVARCTGEALFTVAKINETFKLPGINYDLVNIATSKSTMREFASKNGIRMPHGVKVATSKEFNNTGFGKDIIVKPDFTVVGKKSIQKVDSYDCKKVYKSIDLALLDTGNGIVEIEEFIEGYDCTYLAWLEYGKPTTILTWDELINFDESGYLNSFGISTPSISLSLNQSTKLQKVVDKFSALFPDVRALVALSFRIDAEGEAWLIEVHADITGDLILDKLAPAATGCDYLLEITKLIINGKINSDFSVRCMDSIKPTALLYKNDDYALYDDTALTADDMCILHKNIKNYLAGTSLVQQRLVCDIS